MNNLTKLFFKYWQVIVSIESLAVLVVSVTLLTPTWIYIIQNGANQELQNIKKSAKIAAFLKQNIDENKALQIVNQIKRYPSVKNVEYVSSIEATKTFKSQLSFKNKLDFLGTDILPATLFIEPNNFINLGSLDTLISKINNLKFIDFATLDSYWSLKLDILLSMLDRLFLFITWCSVLVFIIVVFFVTKVLLSTVVNEIKVKLLLGSTYNAINIHYVIQSLYLGTIGALICLIITWIGINWLNIPLANFINQFGVNIGLSMLSIQESLIFIILSSLLYAITAWITCSIILYQMDNNLDQADKF